MDCIKLNDNFRSYLSIYPLNEDLRFRLNIYKDDQINKNISILNSENNSWSNQMKFSFLRPETQVDDTCRVICNEAIGALGHFYKIKDEDLVSNDLKEVAFEKLRDALKDLEDFKDINRAQSVTCCLSSYRFDLSEFNDQLQCNKYLQPQLMEMILMLY